MVSGTNIKTINGNTLLGSGDLVISGGGGSGTVDSAQTISLARGSISVTTGSASSGGSLSYDNSTGVLTFNPADVSSGGGGGASAQAQTPSFNIVGQSGTNQLAEAIGTQESKPIKAYVTSNDVTTAQGLDRNIVQGATIG